VVHFPIVCIALGLIQMINGLWGMARGMGYGILKSKNANATHNHHDVSFQMSLLLSWILQIILQVILQVGYAPAEFLTSAAPTITALTFGLHLMPAFLDYKGQSMLETMSADYYGTEDSSNHGDDDQHHREVMHGSDEHNRQMMQGGGDVVHQTVTVVKEEKRIAVVSEP
jgi:hypothetical protein